MPGWALILGTARRTFAATTPADAVAPRLTVREEVLENSGREEADEAVVGLHHFEAVHIAKAEPERNPHFRRNCFSVRPDHCFPV